MAVIDRDGNALAMTTTIEFAFGAHLMVRGFLLNNELTDFSFVPESNGEPVANRIEERQAAAQLDGADAGVRPQGQAGDERRLGRRRRDHHRCRQDAGRDARLE